MKKAKIISTVLVTAMLLLVSGSSFAEECTEVYAQESDCEDVCFEPYYTCYDACVDDACRSACRDSFITSGYACAAECKSEFYSETCPDPDQGPSAHRSVRNATIGEIRSGLSTYSETKKPSLRNPPAH